MSKEEENLRNICDKVIQVLQPTPLVNEGKETIEQAANRFVNLFPNTEDISELPTASDCFVAGANWQSQQSTHNNLHHLTDEELLTAMEQYHRQQSTTEVIAGDMFEDILEQISPNRPWNIGGNTDAMIIKCMQAAYNLRTASISDLKANGLPIDRPPTIVECLDYIGILQSENQTLVSHINELNNEIRNLKNPNKK